MGRATFTLWYVWLAMIISPTQIFCADPSSTLQNESSINLALRRTADILLRSAGDQDSQIPSASKVSEGVWKVMIPSEFNYDTLPSVLQSSLDMYGISHHYQVSVRRCADEEIVLGYHKLDIINRSNVPCQGRPMDEGCHYLQIAFIDTPASRTELSSGIYLGLILIGLFTSGIWYMKKRSNGSPPEQAISNQNAIKFGNSSLDVENQMLAVQDKTQKLTFRETKLLELFVTNIDQLLERDTIL
ncbi:MAG: hypothetical protein WBO36_13865, partial [Saprospiraceae bacterium]